MELVDGPTLANRIERRPIPLDEVLPIAKQIAEAFDAAHEQGIIHRDLKLANIKVRPDGAAKVLDVGLAKALESTPSGMHANVSTCQRSPRLRRRYGACSSGRRRTIAEQANALAD